MAAAALFVAMAGPAEAAGPGQVFQTGALSLPPGAIAGGVGGYVDGEPSELDVSHDGRYVAFSADADALSADANPDVANVFRKDRATGAVVFVSRATGAAGAAPARSGSDVTISDDGGRVAWITEASLDPADADANDDVYVRDIATDTTILASPGTAGDVEDYDLSGDGAFVALATTEALAGADDANGVVDVYRRRLADGATALASRQAGAAQAGNAASRDPSISDDGRWIAFKSAATNLVAGYVAGAGGDVFARDMTAELGYLVSNKAGAATTGANGPSNDPEIAAAPAAASEVFIAYNSNATDLLLVADDSSDVESVYRRRLGGIAASGLVSRADGVTGANADSRAHVGGISDSGALVTFASDAQNLTPDPDYYGVYTRDVGAGTTVLTSVDTTYAVEPSIAGDGSLVAWINGAGGITPDSDPDLTGVFARGYPAGPPEYVSRPPGSAPFLAPVTSIEGAGTGARTISADGRYVVFTGGSSHLPGTANGAQIFRRDTATGAIELVSRADGPDGAPGGNTSVEPTISADGTRVAFTSYGRLDPADVDDDGAVYLRDLAAATTTLVSRADGAGGALPNSDATDGHISADGRHVTFLSTATNVGGVGGAIANVYLRDVAAGTTQVVDRATGVEGAIGNGDAFSSSPSADGRLVVFTTRANNLDPADPGPSILTDVYVRDTVAATTTLLSRRSGLDGHKATGSSSEGTISADGRVVAFQAADESLATEAGPWGGTSQVVARDLATGQNTLVSRAPGGAVANAAASHPSLSGDGAVIAFRSSATNLLEGVGGGSRHGVFARTMATGALSGPPAFGIAGGNFQNRAFGPSISDDGQCLAFGAFGHNAFSGAAGDFRTGYVYVVSGQCPKPLPPGVAPPPPAGAAQGPAITGASMLRKRFRVGRRPTARRATRAGTAFRFDLSTGADVTIALQRRAAGRRVGGKCRKPAPRLRKRPACVRFVARGRLVRAGRAAGHHSIRFSGRVGRRALRPARYRAVLVARNSAGASQPVRLRFRVVRR